ncbi:MAG TPA: hypothetical protein VFN67_37405 [Polyangiales bacterium]|nr:hypothetical protein [Polyangiales bacterium]
MRLALLVITFAALLACSNDDPKPAADSGAACPASLNDSKATFTSATDDDTCREIADQLNAPSDDAGSECSTEGVSYELRAIDGHCEAEASVSCDGAALAITCFVSPSGDADCTAKLTAPGVPPCDLKLTLRR